MSTMLKSAAMTLLSKTLQTFLYKYLSDVDVEGVALPSLYSSGDQKRSSGWGVRLKNVKLRNGVQLLESLPGSLRRKRRRKRKRRKKKKPQEAKPKHDDITPKIKPRTAQLGERIHGMPSAAPAKTRNEGFDTSVIKTPTRTRATASGEAIAGFHETEALLSPRIGSSAGSVNDDDEDIVEGKRPSTPDQDSKSVFSCFYGGQAYPSTHSLETNSQTKPSGEQPTQDEVLKTPINDQTEDEQSLKDTPSSGVEPPPFLPNRPPDPLNDSASVMSHPISETYDSDTNSHVTSDTKQTHQHNDAEEGPKKDSMEFEWEEYDQKMKLCLGEDGQIGVLDVRLVGKELHVLIEDAFLTLVITPSSKKTQDTSESSEDDEEGVGEPPSEAKETKPKDAASTTGASTKASKNKKDSETVVERVLAENAIARALSSVPHLLLRDIRIRLIIHSEKTGKKGEKAKDPTVVEMGIEFLAMTSGDDALAHFRTYDDENNDDSFDDKVHDQDDTPPVSTIHAFSKDSGGNKYVVRHMRTGRGPEGGIWVKIFTPGGDRPKPTSDDDDEPSPSWARDYWNLTAEYSLLRLSGLDLRSRMYVGTRREADQSSWFYGAEDDNDYDELTLNSMLLDMDSAGPGPPLPLPPMPKPFPRDRVVSRVGRNSYAGLDDTELNGSLVIESEADVYTTDDNGILSSKVPSNFHRVARGAQPGSCCNFEHMPFESCSQCWQETVETSDPNPLDNSLPMPGLAMQITLRDPLDLNVDRPALEAISLLHSIFVEKPDVQAISESPVDDDTAANPERDTDGSSTHMTGQTSKTDLVLSAEKSEERTKEDLSFSFPSYMQPEYVEVLGVHLSEINLRVHVMKSGVNDDIGKSFCYWDVGVQCINLDRQSLSGETRPFQDNHFEVGHISLFEHKGIVRKKLASIGSLYPDRVRSDSLASASSFISAYVDHKNRRVLWPSTACVLLDIPPPLETFVYKARERHALQVRHLAVDSSENSRSSVNARIGVVKVDTSLEIKNQVDEVIDEAMASVLGLPKESGIASTTEPNGDAVDTESPPRSLVSYQVQIDGGDIKLEPLIKTSIPVTRFSGEFSSESGFFIETVLKELHFSFGEKEPPPVRPLSAFSLPELAALPEMVRMRIILFLDDLGPMELALGIKKESNSFLRCRAVNRGIMKMAKKIGKARQMSRPKLSQRRSQDGSNAGRRKEIMAEILRMDDDELETLLSTHKRNRRRSSGGG